MAARKPNLVEAFQAQEEKRKPEIEVVETVESAVSDRAEPKKVTPARANKKHIGGYFDEVIHRQLKIIGAETGMTTQDMLAEALNGFFEKHDKPPIA